MQSRKLTDGTVLSRAKAPIGPGYVYYVDGGPGGLVQVVDTSMTPAWLVAACLEWELTPQHYQGPEPTLEFNQTGFRN